MADSRGGKIFYIVVLISFSLFSKTSTAVELSSKQDGSYEQKIQSIEDKCKHEKECTEINELKKIAIESNDLNARKMAIEAFGRIGGQRSITILSSILNLSMSREIKEKCIMALVEIGGNQVVDILKGYINLESDEKMKDLAQKAIDQLQKQEKTEAAEKVEEKAEKPSTEGEFSFADPDVERVIYTPTAFTREAGKFAATMYDLGYWVFDYTVNKNVQVYLHTNVPAGVFSLGPVIKGTFRVSNNLAFATFFQFMYGFIMWAPDASIGLVGGAPIVITVGNENRFFNVSFIYYHLFSHNYFEFNLYIPNVGGSIRLTDRIRLNAEIYFPTYEKMRPRDFIAGVMYGVRIIGKTMYGDISFIVPILEGSENFLKYVPLGAPFLSFGFTW